jgi:hypothetical protein
MKERSDKSVDKVAVDRRSFLSVALGTLSLHWPRYLCSSRQACII